MQAENMEKNISNNEEQLEEEDNESTNAIEGKTNSFDDFLSDSDEEEVETEIAKDLTNQNMNYSEQIVEQSTEKCEGSFDDALSDSDDEEDINLDEEKINCIEVNLKHVEED